MSEQVQKENEEFQKEKEQVLKENEQIKKPGTNKNPNMSYKTIKTNVRGKMFKVQLLFYSEMARKLQPFLLKYQSDVPLVPQLPHILIRCI